LSASGLSNLAGSEAVDETSCWGGVAHAAAGATLSAFTASARHHSGGITSSCCVPRAVSSCRGNPDALGISPVVEIDTSGSPGFGFEHFKNHDFLREGRPGGPYF
jgi:hypothetical protein